MIIKDIEIHIVDIISTSVMDVIDNIKNLLLVNADDSSYGNKPLAQQYIDIKLWVY